MAAVDHGQFRNLATPPGCRGSARTGCGTAATWLIGSGASPKLVAQQIGHASPSITLGLYSHVLPGYDRVAADAFAQALASARSKGECDQDVTTGKR